MKLIAELNQFLKLTWPKTKREIFGEKSNDEIWDELNSTEEHWTRVIDWLNARIAYEIAQGFKEVAARLQASKIQDT
jgi:hypothetical protein